MEFKSGFVAIIGRPNVGKSTLINNLIGEKVNIITPKPQTTRNRLKAIYTEKRGQVIFLDTPGIHKPHNELDKFMLDQAYQSLKDVDLVVFLVEGTSPFGKGDKYIWKQIANLDKPLLVVMNKIDKLDKELLIKRQRDYQKKTGVNVIPLSAKSGKNLNQLRDEIFENLPSGPRFYPEDMFTDQTKRFIAAEIIREKIFYLTREEVPYGVAVLVEDFKERENGKLYIRANIFVERKSHKGIIIGKNGSRLKKIGKDARSGIEEMLQEKVYLDLWVKVKKDWREDKQLMRRLGYRG